MNRLLALVVPVTLLMGTGCLVEAHSHRPARVAYVEPVAQYRFAGAHPVPDDYGGGWCPEDYGHVHDYQPPQTSYVYTDDVYYYRGPTVVWYWDYHPVPHGGYCSFHGRHSHDFYPHGSWGGGYSYDRGSRGYRWDRSHAASAGNVRYNSGPSRPGPAPHQGDTNVGRRPPPGGNGTGARPPSGSSGGWGRSNAAPAANSPRDNNDNKGGWGTPGSKGRDDDNDSSRGSSGNNGNGNGNGNGGWGNSGSGRSSNSSGNGGSSSSGSSSSGSDRSSGSSSGNGGWGSSGSGRSSGSSSSGNSGGSSSGSGRSSGSGSGGWNTGKR
ncbi:hypothetical protein [Corallococcus sicarius]|uniref:hypothetical protein n=1 Tax=Corallococcus sicarius TaxID=2316726 RepID=UPI001ABF9509|nr:hypothetical protein [Corallococcus sicarius]